jgi:preprotein translocase subunit SecA
MNLLRLPEDVPIEAKMVSKAIQSAQTQVEQQNFEIRKNVLKYDEVLNRQREVIYAERRRVLEGEDLRDQVLHMLADTVEGYVIAATSEGFPEEWDLDKLWTALRTLYPVSLSVAELEEESGGRAGFTAEFLTDEIQADIQVAYEEREAALTSEVMRELERRVIISVLDRKWREHLYEMDYLQEGIGLRAMAQRDPLVEYQREGFDMFSAMMDAIKEESVGYLFNLEVQVEQVEPEVAEVTIEEPVAAPVEAPHRPEIVAKGLGGPQRPAHLSYTAPTVDGEGGVIRVEEDLDEAAAAAGALEENLPQGASRAERRRAAREDRKRRRR